MLNTNLDAVGIIFPNSYDSMASELVSERLMASIPFAGRYRMVDFVLSSMVNCGIDNIAMVVRNNYHSLMDHLGSGREWDLTRKKGGLSIFPPYSEKSVKIFNGRVEALASIMDFLKDCREKYVIMTDTNIAVNFDFNALLDAHSSSGADVTIAYSREAIPADMLAEPTVTTELYYTLTLEDGRVRRIYVNSKEPGIQNFSLNIYVIERRLLMDLISGAFVRAYVYFERDVLMPSLQKLNVRGYRYDGYVARISSLKSYFDENMKLLDERNLDALFSGSPIYTKIRDDNPTRYSKGSVAKNIMAADGCVIEGSVENSVLFRGVKVKKGAKVKNCVLMQDTVVEEGAETEYLISDKNAVISAGKRLMGTDSLPFFVAKGRRV